MTRDWLSHLNPIGSVPACFVQRGLRRADPLDPYRNAGLIHEGQDGTPSSSPRPQQDPSRSVKGKSAGCGGCNADLALGPLHHEVIDGCAVLLALPL